MEQQKTEKEPVLAYRSVNIGFGGKPVIRNLDVSVGRGEILGIVGESGSGKTTLLRAAAGLLGRGGQVSGGIWFQGRNLAVLPEKEMRRVRGAGIGMIFQDAEASLCPVRTVGSQILEAMEAHGNLRMEQAKEQALAMFEALRLDGGERIWDSYPMELSGGMNQRVCIAMAALLKPAVLLADEPTSALDKAAGKQAADELLRLRERFGTAVILVTHDIGLASSLADTLLVLKEGQTAEYGPAAQVSARPRNEYTRRLFAASAGQNVRQTPEREGGRVLLEARDLTRMFPRKGKPDLAAADHIGLSLREGEALGLTGASGCGKSTLARMLARLLEPAAGSVRLEGREITGLRGKELRRVYQEIQMVFQSPAGSFDPRRTIGSSIEETLANQGVSRKERKKQAAELLSRCGLPEELADRYPHEVSGGQCQRAAIARALAARPKILICDEITSALDVTAQQQIMELLQSLKETRQMAFLFISHDPTLVRAFCSRVLVMREGRILE